MAKNALTAMVQNIIELFLKHVLSGAEHKEGKEVLYRPMIRSLVYVSTDSQPDITFLVGILSRSVESPTAVRWEAAKRVLCHLQGTQQTGITKGAIKSGSKRQHAQFTRLSAYSNSDWYGYIVTRKYIWVTFVN